MATAIGFSYARIAKLDPDTEKIVKTGSKYENDKGIITLDGHSAGGTTTGSISGLSSQKNKVYGSDGIMLLSGKGTSPISSNLGVNDMPHELVELMTGMKKDEKTGAALLGTDTNAPYMALELVSHDSKGKPIHFALMKGKFSRSEQNISTNTENENRSTDSLTFDAVNRTSDKNIYAHIFESDVDHFNSDNWDELIFPQSNVVTPQIPQGTQSGDNK